MKGKLETNKKEKKALDADENGRETRMDRFSKQMERPCPFGCVQPYEDPFHCGDRQDQHADGRKHQQIDFDPSLPPVQKHAGQKKHQKIDTFLQIIGLIEIK